MKAGGIYLCSYKSGNENHDEWQLCVRWHVKRGFNKPKINRNKHTHTNISAHTDLN